MQVFHLINTLSPGGAEHVVKDVIANTNAPDVSFSVGYLWGDDSLAPEIEAAGASVTGFDAGFRYSPALVARVAAELRRADVDILHTHLPVSTVVGRIAGLLVGVEVLSTHHNVPGNYQPVSRTLERLTRPLDTETATISRGVRNAWGGPDWHVVYNGIDVEGFRERVSAADASVVGAEVGDADPLLLNVGRYVPEKRQSDLVAMMDEVAERLPDAHLVIVGYGELEDELRARARDHGLSDRVTLTGKVPDVEPYYAAADIFVSSLAYQGMGLVHFEAMAAGLPVVSTDIPDMREVVDDGTTGRLAPPGKPSRLADAVVSLRDEATRDRMGAAGYDKVKSEFSVDRTAERYLELYKEALDGA